MVNTNGTSGNGVKRPGHARHKDPVHWYARARGIVYMGTYATQLEAWEAVRGLDGNPIPEATVWCERQVQGATKGSTRP